PQSFKGIPFELVDPQGDRVPNVILLHAPGGEVPTMMPKSVTLPCGSAARGIHLLGCTGGWGFPYSEQATVALPVRLPYADRQTEDHPLKNGEHVADYAGRFDVPDSEFAFLLAGGQQLRHVTVVPQRPETIRAIEFVKSDEDVTAPVIMAVTVEK